MAGQDTLKGNKLPDSIGWIIALIPAALFTYFATLVPEVSHHPILIKNSWVPSLGINLNFHIDGFALLMALIVTGIGTLIMIYAGGYLKGHHLLGRFYLILLIFMFAMLGIVLADNIILLFIAWELTSITSYLLIGFDHESENARNMARSALVVTGAGGLAMMAGLIMLGGIGESWEFSELIQRGDLIREHALYVPALILVLLGAFTKSAQFPFHFWLPNAMAGPTPVSAYLHSATMVKAGIYLLARTYPILGHTPHWFWILTVVGLTTALLGAWLSWQQTDLKRILAYTTISALGTLVMFIGMGDDKVALKATIVFLVVHALYKGALFMIAGTIDHETGTREIDKLRALARQMPFITVAVILATLSMAGLPPMIGFIGKELMYEATWHAEGANQIWLTAGALLVNVMMVAAAGIMILKPFFGKADEHTAPVHHKPPVSLWLGPVVLGVVALLFGIFSSTHFINEEIISPAVSAVAGKSVETHLALWHGFTPYLVLSLITYILGAALYFFHDKWRDKVVAWDNAVAPKVGPSKLYERGLDGFLAGAGRITNLFQDGLLRHYLLWILATLVLFAGGTLLLKSNVTTFTPDNTIEVYDVILTGIILAGTYLTLSTKSRLTAVAGLGIVGYAIAVIFMLYSAPDLAMTQFSIETLTVVLFVLVLYRLPSFETVSSTKNKIRDGLVASAVGLTMGSLVLSAKAIESSTVLADYFTEFSYAKAKGHNIVNVILVDFRGADTLVEITVLSVAAIGVYTLLTKREEK